ncbi:MAG: ORF6N domain-containing protein [bacterium]|nr:ORF6N domain-containing protein [bacterium]
MNIQIITNEYVEKKIYLVTGKKVMLDFDLAVLYRIETKNLKRAIKRNLLRFPRDFMFQLSKKDAEILRCQIGTSRLEWGGRRYLPYAFTEQGVAMLSSVLRSDRAIQVNIAIMRTFVKLREILSTHEKLAKKLDELESKYDEKFAVVFEAIRYMMEDSSEDDQEPIGFKTAV